MTASLTTTASSYAPLSGGMLWLAAIILALVL